MEVSMDAVCPNNNRRTRFGDGVGFDADVVSLLLLLLVVLGDGTTGKAEASPARSPAIMMSMGDDDDDDDDGIAVEDDTDDGTVANASVQLLFGTLCTTVGVSVTKPGILVTELVVV